MTILNDELKAILGAEALTEETLAALSGMVETYVTKRLEEQETVHLAEAEEIFATKLQEQEAALEVEYAQRLEESTKVLTDKVDGYVNDAVKEFVAENQVAFEQLEDYDRMKAAHKAILESFETNGFVVAKDANTQKVIQEGVDAKQAYTELYDGKKLLEQEVDGLQRQLSFAHLTKDLAATQVEKIVTLSESVAFNSLEEYNTGMKLIVEQVSKAKVEDAPAPVKPQNKLMEQALASLSGKR